MANIIDDKTEHCIPFILKAYEEHLVHRFQNKGAPLFVGVNGVQGSGKTTVMSGVAQKLREEHNLNTLVLSLDDLYLTHEKQQELAKAHPGNPLVQHRGVPGKHYIYLLQRLASWFRAAVSRCRRLFDYPSLCPSRRGS